MESKSANHWVIGARGVGPEIVLQCLGRPGPFQGGGGSAVHGGHSNLNGSLLPSSSSQNAGAPSHPVPVVGAAGGMKPQYVDAWENHWQCIIILPG